MAPSMRCNVRAANYVVQGVRCNLRGASYAAQLRGCSQRGAIYALPPQSLRPLCTTTTHPCPLRYVLCSGLWPGSCATTPQLPGRRPLGLCFYIVRQPRQSLRPTICTTTTHPCPLRYSFCKGLLPGSWVVIEYYNNKIITFIYF